MRILKKWSLAAALLSLALLNYPAGAQDCKQFQDKQGTLHITNPQKAESGKPGTGPQARPNPRRGSYAKKVAPQMSPTAAPSPAEPAPVLMEPEPGSVTPPPEAPAAEAAAPAPEEEAESQETQQQVIMLPPEVMASPEGGGGETGPVAATALPPSRFGGRFEVGREMPGRR